MSTTGVIVIHYDIMIPSLLVCVNTHDQVSDFHPMLGLNSVCLKHIKSSL